MAGSGFPRTRRVMARNPLFSTIVPTRPRGRWPVSHGPHPKVLQVLRRILVLRAEGFHSWEEIHRKGNTYPIRTAGYCDSQTKADVSLFLLCIRSFIQSLQVSKPPFQSIWTSGLGCNAYNELTVQCQRRDRTSSSGLVRTNSCKQVAGLVELPIPFFP